MKLIQHLSILALALMVAIPLSINAQENSAPVEPAAETSPRTPHFSIGVLGGLDRNYHIVDMSYMTDYSFSPYAPGTSYGVQLGYSPWKWLTFRVDGVMLNKNYYREHGHGCNY